MCLAAKPTTKRTYARGVCYEEGGGKLRDMQSDEQETDRKEASARRTTTSTCPVASGSLGIFRPFPAGAPTLHPPLARAILIPDACIHLHRLQFLHPSFPGPRTPVGGGGFIYRALATALPSPLLSYSR